MPKKKLKVLILGGGPSSEHEVSLKTAEMVHLHLDRKKYEPYLVTITKTGEWLNGRPKAQVLQDLAQRGGASRAIPQQRDMRVLAKLCAEADVAFIAMHGEFGEDGQVQKILEKAKLPYTGSGVSASALGMDKGRSQAVFAQQGLNIPESLFFGSAEYTNNRSTILKTIKNKFHFPVVIKPADSGSSVGVSIVRTAPELTGALKKAFKISPNILAQEFVSGTELTCGVLDDGKNNLTPLPPTEIVPKIGTFFDYESKYKESGSEEITPARVPAEIIKGAQDIAIKAHVLIGCSGMSRTDMIWNKESGKIYTLEINTIPGLTAQSLLPKAALASGISFPKLLDRIIQSALVKKS